jgi:beta-barrel assembly-enhancing protease
MFQRTYLTLLLAVLFAFTACASTKNSDRYREGNNKGQKSALTVEEEKKLSQEALGQMKKEYPPVQNPLLQDYIEKLGQKLVRVNNLHDQPYTYNFTVVDTPTINAFALPAGKIFMTAPIIAMADSEAELAGILGHEIGHVVARHTAERMYVAKKEQGKTWLMGGTGAVLGGAAGFLLSKKLCKPDDTACKAKLTVYGAGGGAGAGLLVQKYSFMQNSQEDELESDRVGFRYAVNAGYHPDKVGDFFKKLKAMEDQSKKKQGNSFLSSLSDAMASHPPSAKRVDQAEELRRSSNKKSGITTTEEFFQMKKLAQEVVAKQNKKNISQQSSR